MWSRVWRCHQRSKVWGGSQRRPVANVNIKKDKKLQFDKGLLPEGKQRPHVLVIYIQMYMITECMRHQRQTLCQDIVHYAHNYTHLKQPVFLFRGNISWVTWDLNQIFVKHHPLALYAHLLCLWTVSEKGPDNWDCVSSTNLTRSCSKTYMYLDDVVEIRKTVKLSIYKDTHGLRTLL